MGNAIILKPTRACVECNSPMKLVSLTPAHTHSNSKTYTCSHCDNTEKVITLNKSWLNVCAAAEPSSQTA